MCNWLDYEVFADLGMLILRVVSASLIVHHGLVKVENPHAFADHVIAAYFPFLGAPLFWTYLSAAVELGGSFCLVVGLFVRPAAGLLAGTMMVATTFQLLAFGLQNYPFGQPPSGPAYTFEPSLAFLAATGHVCLSGPGRFALQPHFPSPAWLKAHTHPIFSLLKEPLFSLFSDFGMLVLRVVTASLIVHHGLVKVENPHAFADHVIAAYFPFLGAPLFWTYLSAAVELGGSFCLVVGLFVRPAAGLLAGTMMVATTFQLLAFGLQNYPFGQPPSGPAYTFEPSLAFLAFTIRIATAGPGRFGIQTSCQRIRPLKSVAPGSDEEAQRPSGRTYHPEALDDACMRCLCCGAAPTVKEDVDVILIGAGIMSTTLGLMLMELEPTWRIHIYESLPNAGDEASNGWNNSGTGHAALCELNYTPENKATGEIDISKAVAINEQFQVSRQLWSYLVKQGLLPTPKTFITRTPHMSFVEGEKNVDFLRRRCELLQKQPLFEGMEFTSDIDQIRQWAPLLLSGRDTSAGAEPMGLTRVEEGTDVDYGTLTKHLARAFIAKGGVYQSNSSARSFEQDADGRWRVAIHKDDLSAGGMMEVRAPFVFIGAGGATIQLLQKTGIPEIQGFGAFPISGQFLCCQNPAIVSKHPSKIYGLASVGAPPMSVPHLDARFIDGQPMVLFGPFAGFSPRYLKSSSIFDLISTIRWHNLIPMTAAGLQNLDLVVYLVKELLASKHDKLEALRKFVPDARPEDWGYAAYLPPPPVLSRHLPPPPTASHRLPPPGAAPCPSATCNPVRACPALLLDTVVLVRPHMHLSHACSQVHVGRSARADHEEGPQEDWHPTVRHRGGLLR